MDEFEGGSEMSLSPFRYIALGILIAGTPLLATDCSQLPDVNQLKQLLAKAPNAGGEEGGLFHGKQEWAVSVNRDGQVCAFAASQSDPGKLWPGSLSIAKAKAFTANAFSTDDMPLSTARLYTLTQPGHSLWGIAASNPFAASDVQGITQALASGPQKIEGGLIAFGGGVPLYKGGKIVGGLGVSGDTACADHETAKRMRHLAGLEPAGGAKADDITYPSADGPSVFSHPLCQNTYRDGRFLGNEAPATFDHNVDLSSDSQTKKK
jgi:uncharacterized protein GlcG (DUF336 family)